MRYIIWRCPKCKKLKLTESYQTKVLNCNPCEKTIRVGRAIKIFPHGYYKEAMIYFKELGGVI